MSSLLKRSTKDVNSYKSILFVCMFSKIMKILMVNRLVCNFLELHLIISQNQFGLRGWDSSDHSLTSIPESIKETIAKKRFGLEFL